MIRVQDALGATVTLEAPARRIVSLVPSVTETLFELGCGSRLVGCTGFCIHPADGVAGLVKVGGTKDPDIERIRGLHPDLVLANQEENRREDVEALSRTLNVHVSYPRDLVTLFSFLRDVGTLLGVESRASAMADGIERARRSYAQPPRPLCALYLVWRKPTLAAGSDTFIDAMLRECGFDNFAAQGPSLGVAADGKGSGAASRYPEIELGDFRDRGLEAVLLSSEPFPFAERHRAEVASVAGLPLARVQLVSGEAFSWFGCRTATVFTEAARVLAALGSAGRQSK